MDTIDNENLIRCLKEYDNLCFCLRLILYYQKNINNITDLTQIDCENLLENLPVGINKVIKLYRLEDCAKLMGEEAFGKLLRKNREYLIENIKSIFSFWNKMFLQFADLYFTNQELMAEVFSELNIPGMGDLRKLLYVGENFDENTLSELLCILIRLANYQEIHIINYDTGIIHPSVCMENVRDELYYVEPKMLESMMKRIVIVEEPQLNFEYLNTYVEQNAAGKFVIVIGMERLVEFMSKSEISVKLMQCNFSLGTSETVNWELLVNNINKLYAQIKENSAFLLTVYVVNNALDDAKQKIHQHYKDELIFDVLFDQTRPAFDGSIQDRKLFGEIFDLIFSGNGAYEKILEHKEELSEDDFIILKVYFYLSKSDFFQAISELEQLHDDTDLDFKFLLAELYSIIGDTGAAYVILKEIYTRDKYYPNLVNAIVYSLRDSENKDELLSWIKKGLAVNPYDPVLVNHLANFYTWTGDYLASAEQWKILYDLTGKLFYAILSEINYILLSADRSQLNYIRSWVDEKVSMYPQYSDEINNRIGIVIFDKINGDKALPYFESVAESYDESYCIAAAKIVEIYYKMYSRQTNGVKQCEIEDFVQRLLKRIMILTYSAQSVYAWSSYIHKLFHYEGWMEVSTGLLTECLLKLVEGYLKGDADSSRLIVNEANADNIEGCFEDYEDSRTPNLEVMNTDEYLLLLLAQGKSKISEGEIQAANDIAYTLFRLASMYEENFYKNISMSFGLLVWAGASMAISAYVEGILSFIAAADKLMEMHETAVLHETGFVFDQFLYLYSGSIQIGLDSANLMLLEKYFDSLEYPKVLLYHIFGRYERIMQEEPSEFRTLINQMEKANIILLTKNESLDNIIFYDALISSYYKTGELDKAGVYLQRLFPSIIMSLMDHIDIAYHLLMRYTDILMDLRDFNSVIGILGRMFQVIEKLRGLSFCVERSYLGDPADTIIRRILHIYCKKGSLCDEKLEADELLCKMLINMVPKSIIEQKNGHAEANVDEILLRKEKEYYLLFELLSNAKKKSVGDLIYKRTVDRFFEIKQYLEKNHPDYKPLEAYALIGWKDGNPFEFLKSKLKEGEVFYRNILAENYLIHILVTENVYHICSEKIDLKELEKCLDHLEKMIDKSVDDLERMESDSYIPLFENLTKMLFQPLVDRMDRMDSLYYMPDYKLRHITPNFIRVNNKWGVECFSKIELIIDYNNIGNSKTQPNHWRNFFYTSNSSKGGLQEIRKTMDKFQYFEKLELNRSGHIEIQESVNILVIAAHGISEEFGKSYNGAKKLELSRKKQVDLNEFIILNSATVENAIIIACSGGTPTNAKIERNNGVWDSLLRKNVKYILYCKWDVSTKHTNTLLAAILEEMKTNEKLLSEALNIAQRKMVDLNPILWAGLEVWNST